MKAPFLKYGNLDRGRGVKASFLLLLMFLFLIGAATDHRYQYFEMEKLELADHSDSGKDSKKSKQESEIDDFIWESFSYLFVKESRISTRLAHNFIGTYTHLDIPTPPPEVLS